MRGVGHIQTENIHARVHQLADHFGGIGGGAEGCNDFCPPEAAPLHGLKIILLAAIKKHLIAGLAENQLAKDARRGHIFHSI
jgi:hypothetical protein